MNHRDNYNESGPHHSQAKDLSRIKGVDWTKTIGKTLISKDELDMSKIVVDDDEVGSIRNWNRSTIYI